MNKINFKNISIKHLVKPRLKNIYLSVSKDFEVVIKSPKISSSALFDILSKKETWIRKKLVSMRLNKVKSFHIGSDVLLFDELVCIESETVADLKLLIKRSKNRSKENMLKKYDLFYKRFCEQYITQRVNYFSTMMGLEYSQIKYRKMKSRWGSCSSKKVLTFNTELLKIKKELIDYVVVHELAHLKHMNHSKSFHALVGKYLSSSKAYRDELKAINLRAF